MMARGRLDQLIDRWGALGDRERDAALRAAEGSFADWRAGRGGGSAPARGVVPAAGGPGRAVLAAAAPGRGGGLREGGRCLV